MLMASIKNHSKPEQIQQKFHWFLLHYLFYYFTSSKKQTRGKSPQLPSLYKEVKVNNRALSAQNITHSWWEAAASSLANWLMATVALKNCNKETGKVDLQQAAKGLGTYSCIDCSASSELTNSNCSNKS